MSVVLNALDDVFEKTSSSPTGATSAKDLVVARVTRDGLLMWRRHERSPGLAAILCPICDTHMKDLMPALTEGVL